MHEQILSLIIFFVVLFQSHTHTHTRTQRPHVAYEQYERKFDTNYELVEYFPRNCFVHVPHEMSEKPKTHFTHVDTCRLCDCIVNDMERVYVARSPRSLVIVLHVWHRFSLPRRKKGVPKRRAVSLRTITPSDRFCHVHRKVYTFCGFSRRYKHKKTFCEKAMNEK